MGISFKRVSCSIRVRYIWCVLVYMVVRTIYLPGRTYTDDTKVRKNKICFYFNGAVLYVRKSWTLLDYTFSSLFSNDLYDWPV